MCSLQSTSVTNFGTYSSEQLEDDFITSLFSENIENNSDCLQISQVKTNQNAVQSESTSWLLAHQMDHGYVAPTVSTSVQQSTWNEPMATNTSMNMSTYFSTFDPSTKSETNKSITQDVHSKLNNNEYGNEKVQRARINVIPTGNGTFKTIVKRKRKRTVFRTEQVEAMEEVFAMKPYVTKEDRKFLVDRLKISDKSVKVWFQNRRLKNRRGDDYPSDDENRSSPNLDRLDYVESKIHERTNEFGYVTLDDKIMNDLINVIDEYLWKPNTENSTNTKKIEETHVRRETVPIYEPISPASTIENSTEESVWECPSVNENEYLQRLMDIESIISC